MPEFFKDYFSKAWDHWVYLVGLLLMVEPLLDYCIADYQRWANRYVSRERRTRFARWVSVIALLVVGAFAFKDQYEETKTFQDKAGQADALAKARLAEIEGSDGKGGLKEQIASLQAQLKESQRELAQSQAVPPREVYKYLPAPPVTVAVQIPQRHLSQSERQALQTALASMKDQLKGLIVFSEGVESTRYALDFVDVLKKAGVTTVFDWPVPAYGTLDSDKGVLVGFKDPQNPSDLGKRFMDVLRSAGLSVHSTRSSIQGAMDFDLFIASE
jgi:hypothetical protein